MALTNVQIDESDARDIDVLHNVKSQILMCVVNLCLIVELCIAMYFAAKNPAELTPIFFRVFFSMLIPTLICAWIARRIILSKAKKALSNAAN